MCFPTFIAVPQTRSALGAVLKTDRQVAQLLCFICVAKLTHEAHTADNDHGRMWAMMIVALKAGDLDATTTQVTTSSL